MIPSVASRQLKHVASFKTAYGTGSGLCLVRLEANRSLVSKLARPSSSNERCSAFLLARADETPLAQPVA